MRLTFLSLICLVHIPYCDNILIILTDTLGLIQNVDEDLIQTVKDLIKHYVAKKKTLIVIAMPMTGLVSATNLHQLHHASSSAH